MDDAGTSHFDKLTYEQLAKDIEHMDKVIDNMALSVTHLFEAGRVLEEMGRLESAYTFIPMIEQLSGYLAGAKKYASRAKEALKHRDKTKWN